METRSVLRFFAVAVALYGCINLYLWTWLLRAFRSPLARGAASALLALSALAYPVGRILSRRLPCPLSDAVQGMGSLYLAFMAMAVILALFAESLLLLARLGGFRPGPSAFTGGVLAAVVLVGTVTVLGARVAESPRVRIIELELPRLEGAGRDLTLALVTDIHAGAVIHNARLKAMVDLIGSLDADLILFGGDIVDHSVTEAVEQDLAGELSRLAPPLGLYGVAGNHEYYSGLEPATAHIEEGGMTMLLDGTAVIADTLLLVGRHDVQAPRFGYRRASLQELTAPFEGRLPVVVLDHTPRDTDEAAAAGAALLLSGHTHRGQLWPFNLITRRLFETDYGLLKKGGTWIYVSSGLGTWGPPVRTSGRPEVVLFRLRFRRNPR